MDHAYIEENSLIERYHRGDLEPEEEERFEAHFLECAECTEELEWARGFRLGIQSVAAEEATRMEVAVRLGLLARWTRWSRRRPVAFALIAAAGAALLASSLTSLWQEGRGITGSSQPLANPPLTFATTLRGGDEIAILDFTSADWATLAVDIEADPDLENYRLVVTQDIEELWRGERLQPNSLGTLMVTFPADYFPGGEYLLSVEAVGADGRSVALESYPFRVKNRGE